MTPVLFAGTLPLASTLAIAGDYFAHTGTDTYKEEYLIVFGSICQAATVPYTDQAESLTASWIPENLTNWRNRI